MAMPFWIDDEDFTDREKKMFTAGVEFEMVRTLLKSGGPIQDRPVHRYNERRIRKMCRFLKRAAMIVDCPADQDPNGTWSWLTVRAAEERV